MNRINQHVNIIVVCMGLVGTTMFITKHMHKYPLYYFLSFIIGFLPLENCLKTPRPFHCIIGLLSTLSVFIKSETISMAVASLALSLSLNLGYNLVNGVNDELYHRIYQGSLNLSLSLGIILAELASIFSFDEITLNLAVLVFTLPHFYLPYYEQALRSTKREKVYNKATYIMIPLYFGGWVYSLGFTIGVYIATFSLGFMTKYIKCLLISLLLLIQILTYKDLIIIFS